MVPAPGPEEMLDGIVTLFRPAILEGMAGAAGPGQISLFGDIVMYRFITNSRSCKKASRAWLFPCCPLPCCSGSSFNKVPALEFVSGHASLRNRFRGSRKIHEPEFPRKARFLFARESEHRFVPTGRIWFSVPEISACHPAPAKIDNLRELNLRKATNFPYGRGRSCQSIFTFGGRAS